MAHHRLLRETRSTLLVLQIFLLPFAGLPLLAESWLSDEAKESPIHHYKSRSFSLYSDLDEEQTKLLLQRMERSLKTCSTYWGQPLRGRVEAYVVSDLSRWRSEDFPHPLGRILIHRVGGAVDVRKVREGRRLVRKCILYAAATPGIAEHEVVHAYCTHVFGTSGPGWYREGMAELDNNQDVNNAIQCPVEVISELQNGTPRHIATITQDVTMADSIFDMLSDLGKRRRSGIRLTRAEKRELESGKTLHDTRRSYCWCWALCHFLEHNPNYNQRFRALGKAYLNRQRVSFDRAFAGMLDELKFEYQQFLRHVDNGYRVDLCSWKWGVDCDSLSPKETLRVSVRADHGYQPTRLLVVSGEQYQFQTEGKWFHSARPQTASAESHAGHHGQLEAVVFDDFKLSEPIELGPHGVFTAPADGQLCLRCQDNWNELGDNLGVVRVTFSRKNVK